MANRLAELDTETAPKANRLSFLETAAVSVFDPEGTGYDDASAAQFGLTADITGHFPSRVPQTGLLLKGRRHKTWSLTVAAEEKAGYEIYKGEDGRYYSRKKAVEEPGIDWSKEPLVDLTREPVNRFELPIPIAGADPTSIGPQPGLGLPLPRKTASQIIQEQFPEIDFAGTELVSGDQVIPPAITPKEEPVVRPREFKGAADEFIRALAGGTLNVGSGLLATFGEIAGDSVFDVDRINELADMAREASRAPKFQPATDGGVKGFVANAVGNAMPFMAATVAATIVGGPAAGFSVAYAVEGKSAYFDALDGGASQGQAEMEGMVVGSINAVLESLQVGRILKFAKKGGGSFKSVAQAAKKNVLKRIAKEGKALTKETVKLAITEGIQESLQETTAILAPLITGREIQPEGKAKRIAQAGLGGAVVGVLLGGGGRITQTLIAKQAAEPEPPAVAPPVAKPPTAPVVAPPKVTKAQEAVEAPVKAVEAVEPPTKAQRQHKAAVEQLFKEGKPVKQQDREMYPDLVEKYEKVAPVEAEVAPTGVQIVPPTEAVPTPTAAKETEAETWESEQRAKLEKLKAVRFKTAPDEAKIERIEKQLKEDTAKWKEGQGVGWRVVKGQVNRGLRIVETHPEAHQATIQFVKDVGVLADYKQGETHLVDMIDLVRDKKFDAAITKPPVAVKPAPAVAEPEVAIQDEWKVINQYLVEHDASKGKVPAQKPYLSTRDEQFAELVNAGKESGRQSSLYPGRLEHAEDAILIGEKLGYRPDDIAAYLQKNYIDQPPVEVKPAPIEAVKEPSKPVAVNRLAAIEKRITETDVSKTLMTERAEVKQVPPKDRTPQQVERLTEIEDELVERSADEFPDIDITEKARTAERRKVRDQIKEHGVYQSELDAIEDLPDIPSKINVDSTEIGDVKARFEGRPEMLKVFNLQEQGGARWDQAAAEIGIDNLDDFMDAVELSVESGKAAKGGINEVALAKALNSGDPSIELFAVKREMLKQGFNAAEINKELQNIADGLGIAQEFVDPELISLEEITDVGKKQQILKELDRAFKKTAEKKDIQPEEATAISKAKLRAQKENRPIYVVERQGRFIVTTREPRRGSFVKVTRPETGETAGKTERIQAKEKERPKPRVQAKEQKLLIQRINIEVKKKGLTQTLFSDLKMKHGGSRRLTGTTPRTVEQLEAILKAVERARPTIIAHKKVISPKTEKQIAELKDNLTKLGFMNDGEFKTILDIEVRGREPKYTDARNFITQQEGREILARMHDTAQRLRVTEQVRQALANNPLIAAEIAKIQDLPRKVKDPSRLRSIRFFFQRMGEQAKEPIYDVFLDLTLEGQLRSRGRHKVMKLAEALPGFARIANDPKALKRVEDWIVSKSVLKDRPAPPENITETEIILAKLIQESFKSYETLARTGKFFEFFDNRAEMPQYLKFKQGIDKAFDVYNTKGYDALVEYLETQDWGIVSAGYSPMESVIKKVSTHRMPDIAVGKGHIRQRSIVYRKQDRDILQRWYSYMRQMDQLIHLQPRIKSLVRLVNDNQASFRNPQKINSVVSTYLDNLKHTNYEDGLIEEWMRRFYSQAITVRILADPVKPLRNILQNLAFSEDRRDFLDLRNKRLTAEDIEYLDTHVEQASVMMTDWAFVGEDPLVFKRLTKWVQRHTLYPWSDRVNRLMSFHAKINRVRRAFAKDKPLQKQMRDARFSDMQKAEQTTALGILAKDDVDAMARYIAKVHTDNTHFLYAREQRSPAEQTKVGRLGLNLFLFRRAALEKSVFQLQKVFQKGTGFGAKLRAAKVLTMLLAMSVLVGMFWKRATGKKYSPYSYWGFLEFNWGGLMLAMVEIVEAAYNSMLSIITLDPKKAGKAIDDFGRDLAKVADYMIPFYDLGLRGIEAYIGSENIDRVPARKLRELIDGEYKTRGVREIDRSLVDKIQFTFTKGGKKEPDKTTDDLIW